MTPDNAFKPDVLGTIARGAEDLLEELDGDLALAKRPLGLVWGQKLPHHWPEDGRFDQSPVAGEPE